MGDIVVSPVELGCEFTVGISVGVRDCVCKVGFLVVSVGLIEGSLFEPVVPSWMKSGSCVGIEDGESECCCDGA